MLHGWAGDKARGVLKHFAFYELAKGVVVVGANDVIAVAKHDRSEFGMVECDGEISVPRKSGSYALRGKVFESKVVVSLHERNAGVVRLKIFAGPEKRAPTLLEVGASGENEIEDIAQEKNMLELREVFEEIGGKSGVGLVWFA